MTNRYSLCVSKAIEWALRMIEDEGELKKLFLKWLPVEECGSTDSSSTSNSNSSSGRRLQSEDFSRYEERVDFSRFEEPLEQSSEGRRMQEATSEENDASTYKGVTRLGLNEFMGIFVIWGIVTVVIVGFTLFREKALPHLLPYLKSRVRGTAMEVAVEEMEKNATNAPERSVFDLSEVNAGDINGNIMLLMRQMGEIHERLQSGSNGHTGAGGEAYLQQPTAEPDWLTDAARRVSFEASDASVPGGKKVHRVKRRVSLERRKSELGDGENGSPKLQTVTGDVEDGYA